jgi:hypothetical protein
MSKRNIIAAAIIMAFIFWGCNLFGGSPTPTQEVPLLPTPTQGAPTLPSPTSAEAEPTQSPPEIETPTTPACSLSALSDATVYTRPSTDSGIFGTLSAGMSVDALARTVDGWLGFDPGVAQAANTGVFRLRWVQESGSISMQGNCDALPLVSGPPAGICFEMPMDETPVYAAPDSGAALVATLSLNDYAAVIGRSPNNWYRIDMALGNAPSDQAGWIAEEMINLNGPCEALPLINIPAGEKFTPSALNCTLTANAGIAAYARPSTQANFFGNFQTGMSVPASAKTADGWIGFDPGVAQAANIGIFRLRWVEPGTDFTLSGNCDQLPIVIGPPPNVCFTMAMGDSPILEEPNPAAGVAATLHSEEFAAVIAQTSDHWYRVDLGFGNALSNLAGWLQGDFVNFNGPCENLPVVSP